VEEVAAALEEGAATGVVSRSRPFGGEDEMEVASIAANTALGLDSISAKKLRSTNRTRWFVLDSSDSSQKMSLL